MKIRLLLVALFVLVFYVTNWEGEYINKLQINIHRIEEYAYSSYFFEASNDSLSDAPWSVGF